MVKLGPQRLVDISDNINYKNLSVGTFTVNDCYSLQKVLWVVGLLHPLSTIMDYEPMKKNKNSIMK